MTYASLTPIHTPATAAGASLSWHPLLAVHQLLLPWCINVAYQNPNRNHVLLLLLLLL
jgi:hypothetical protein